MPRMVENEAESKKHGWRQWCFDKRIAVAKVTIDAVKTAVGVLRLFGIGT